MSNIQSELVHFKHGEFDCKCGCGGGFKNMDRDFLDALDVAREFAKVPFNLSSAFRCESHNEKVGGAPFSSYTRGYAVDIAAPDDFIRIHILNGLIKAGFNRIGIYKQKNFIHVDADPAKTEYRCWLK